MKRTLITITVLTLLIGIPGYSLLHGTDPHETLYYIQNSYLFEQRPVQNKQGYEGVFEDIYLRQYSFKAWYEVGGYYHDADTSFFVRIVPGHEKEYTFWGKKAKEVWRYCDRVYKFKEKRAIIPKAG